MIPAEALDQMRREGWASLDEQGAYWDRQLQRAAEERQDFWNRALLEAQQAWEMEQEDAKSYDE